MKVDLRQYKHSELTGRVLKAAFEVANELGFGYLESVYQRALMMVLQDYGLKATEQVPMAVMFRGTQVGQFYADIVIEGKVILELKALPDLSGEHEAQLINYLQASGIEVGLLLNFGTPRLQYRRCCRPLQLPKPSTQS
jgi:GxxExxY protein